VSGLPGRGRLDGDWRDLDEPARDHGHAGDGGHGGWLGELAIYAGSNFGFLVKDATESTTTTCTNRYSSRTGANPPQLVITWG